MSVHVVGGVTTRAATPEDVPFLWQMLTLAASMEGGADDVERAMSDPGLRGYVEGFGRKGDLGVIALVGEERVGAGWLRLLDGEPHPSKVWTHEVPELAIATVRDARGRGIGTHILRALIDASLGLHPAIALSVREGNPAIALYERLGFVEERRVVNRVGGASLVMRQDTPYTKLK
jgi:ribosomal protein S18 acetylase RimI-like enzyme